MNTHVYADILKNTLQKHASLPCLHIKRNGIYKSWTFQDFHHDLNRLSSILKKWGLKKGTNAIVIGENSPEWLIAHHAIILTGACAVPVDPNIPPSEIESITEITQAKIVFCSLGYLKMFKSLRSKFSFIDRIISLDACDDEYFDRILQGCNEPKDAFSIEFQPDDPTVIIFTSGTTGKAKGVVLCQKNFTAVATHAVPRMKLTSNDTACAVLPLHHVFGFAACIVGPLAAGTDIVFVPHVKGPLILEALREKEVTYLPAVPKMLALFYESILHNVKKKGPLVQTLFTTMKMLSAASGNKLGTSFQRNLFSSVHKSFGGKLRLIISGGAALNKRYWLGFRQMGFTIVEGYGLTETFGPITVSPGENARWGSVGPALPENSIRIHEPDVNGIGEVLLKGTCVFNEYYRNDEQIREVFDGDKWFHTGDLGRLDKDGFLYLAGRKKDMIVLDSGKNVYPDELEDIFGASPLIEEIGVFGISTNNGEIVAAAIVPVKEVRKSNTIPQATDMIYDELIRIGKSLPVYRRINDFITVYNPLPRTTTRKLKKQELRKLYNSIKRKTGVRVCEEQLSVLEMALMETEEYIATVSAITSTSPKTEPGIINPRSHLEIDLGLDSLQKIELLTLIERRFAITVPDDIFQKMETVADIVSLIKENRDNKRALSVENIMSLKERILNESPPYLTLPAEASLIDHIALPLARNLVNGFIQPSVKGIHEVQTVATPIIFASNHNHHDDVFDLLDSLPKRIRNKTFHIVDDKHTKYSPLRKVLYQRNLITGNKEYDSIDLLRMSIAFIRGNKHLIAFPEGTISKPLVLGHFKSAIGLLACETGATIIPVKIAGPAHLASKQIQSDKKTIIFGKPISYRDLFDNKPPSVNSTEEMTSVVRSAIEHL